MINQSASSPGLSEPLPNDTPTHFDSLLTAPELPSSEGGGDISNSAAMLQPEEFHKVFCLAFNVGSAVTRLKSLTVNEGDDRAINCSRAIYDTCLEIPALHFLLQPGGKWGGRILAIGAFAIPMSLAVKDELQERHRAGAVSSAGGTSIPAPEDTLAKFNQMAGA